MHRHERRTYGVSFQAALTQESACKHARPLDAVVAVGATVAAPVTRTTPRSGPRYERVLSKIIELLEASQEGLRKQELADACGVSKETIQRRLVWLRREHDAPLVEHGGVWRLTEPFALPFLAPKPDDLTAMALARAVLGTFADPTLNARLDALVRDLDERLRDAGRRGLVPARGVSATMTFGTTLDKDRLETILQATRGEVLEIEHRAVWRDEASRGSKSPIRLEPWGCRVHDGLAYVRGFARERGGPRTYRIVDLRKVRRIPGEHAQQRRPTPAHIWDDDDPAFGIDHDRPGHARIVVKGPLARWIEPVIFHPKQTGRWIEPDELLERELPYRSCRELARRLLGYIDGLVEVEPEELRLEMSKYVKAAVDRGVITGIG